MFRLGRGGHPFKANGHHDACMHVCGLVLPNPARPLARGATKCHASTPVDPPPRSQLAGGCDRLVFKQLSLSSHVKRKMGGGIDPPATSPFILPLLLFSPPTRHASHLLPILCCFGHQTHSFLPILEAPPKSGRETVPRHKKYILYLSNLSYTLGNSILIRNGFFFLSVATECNHGCDGRVV